MPTIKTPDGRRIRVPDDATPEQIQQVLAIAAGTPAGTPPPGGPAPAPAAPAATGGPVGGQGAPAATPPVPAGAPDAGADHLQQYVNSMPGMEKFLAGMGASVDSNIRGVRQIWNKATGDEEDLAKLEADENEARRANEPLLNSGAGFGGNIAGHALQFAVPGGAAARAAKITHMGLPAAVLAEGAVGAGAGAVAPTVGDESRAQNALVGGAFGAAMPLGTTVARTVMATPSRILRSNVLRGVAPRGLGAMADLGSMLIGNTGRATKRGGDKIARIASEAKVEIQPLVNKLQPVMRRFGSDMPASVRAHVDELAGLAKVKSAKLKGEMLQNLASAAYESASTLSGPARIGLRQIGRIARQHLDDALPADRARALQQARTAYRTGVKPTNPSQFRMTASAMINALRGNRPPNEEEEAP